MGLLGKWGRNETEKEALAFTKILALLACIDGNPNEKETALLGSSLIDAKFDLSKIGLSQKDFFNAGCEAGAVLDDNDRQIQFVKESANLIKDHEKKVSLLTICAKLAQADGEVCDKEMKLLYHIGNFLDLSREERVGVVGKIFSQDEFIKYGDIEIFSVMEI